MKTPSQTTEELASSLQNSVDQRWQRLLQTKSYPYANTAIGGALCPDPEVEDLHDFVRFLHITQRSPFPVFQLARTSDLDSLFFNDNVFIYTQATAGKPARMHIPPHLKDAYAASSGFNGLKVAMVMSKVKEEVIREDSDIPADSSEEPLVEYNDINTFSAIVIDEARGVVHRIEPDKREKPLLDDAIENALKEAGCRCKYIRPASENNGTGPSYWAVDFHETPELTSASFVLYKQAIFWTLQCRLAFGDMAHSDFFSEYVKRWNALEGTEIQPLIMNFYVGFTNEANFSAFGSIDYIGNHSSVRFMPCYVVQMNDWLRKMSYDNLNDADPSHFELSDDVDCADDPRDCED